MTVSPEATETGVQSSAAEDVFVARQPIFHCDKRVYAYELLFRDGLENVCSIADSHRAASHVLQAAWLTFGLPALIGQNRAFVNFSRDLLLAGYGETLPVESVVIKLLETIDGDADVVEACAKLKRSGYLVALDEFVYRAELEPLLERADIVKIRFRDSDPAEQAAHVRRLAPHSARLLAEAVETQEEYDQAVGLGFTYFQGYFFCRPQIIKGRALSGSRLTYLKLLQAVTAPALNIAELDRIIQADVSIAHRLMKYLGSASFSFRGTVTSVRQGRADRPMPMTTPPTSSRPTTPIRDDGRPSPTTMLQEELEATERRFMGHDGDQLMMSLKQLVIEHITRSQTDD